MNTLFNQFISICDAPRAWGVYFQDSASPQMEALVELQDDIMFYLVIVLCAVSWILVAIMINLANRGSTNIIKYFKPCTFGELILIFTYAPFLFAFYVLELLYLMDGLFDPCLSAFVEGHQWYWSYQYPDFLNEDDEEIEFDSYLITERVGKWVFYSELDPDQPIQSIETSDDLIESSSSSSNGSSDDDNQEHNFECSCGCNENHEWSRDDFSSDGECCNCEAQVLEQEAGYVAEDCDCKLCNYCWDHMDEDSNDSDDS